MGTIFFLTEVHMWAPPGLVRLNPHTLFLEISSVLKPLPMPLLNFANNMSQQNKVLLGESEGQKHSKQVEGSRASQSYTKSRKENKIKLL